MENWLTLAEVGFGFFDGLFRKADAALSDDEKARVNSQSPTPNSQKALD
jgi:hypothetical protein